MRPTMLPVLVLAAAVVAGALDISWTREPAHTGTATSSLPTAEIVFTRHVSRPPRDDLYVAAADGSRLRLLVRDAAEAGVSPDGRRIAFVRGRAIWSIRRDGSEQRQLTRPGIAPGTSSLLADRDPAWSPDGRTLYFARSFGEDGALLSVRADGTHLVTLTRGVRWYLPGEPAPSPDRRTVAFTRFDVAHGCCGGIGAVTRAGKDVTLPFRFPQLGAQTIYDLSYEPSWSPDGRKLAYAHSSDTTSAQVFVSRADGSTPHLLADGSSPAWSPDGTWIAFRGHGIALVRSDGSGLRRLARSGPADAAPAWLPPAR